MAALFQKEMYRIIEFILDSTSKTTKVRELARLLNLSPAHVSRTLKTLERHKIIKNGSVDLSNPYVKALKIFFNIQKLTDSNVIRILKKIEPAGAGIYGSWANGTNNETSDVDIWIKVEKKANETKIAVLSSKMRKALRRNIQLLVLTPERIGRLKRDDPIFYYSLVFGSINIYGESLE